MHAWRADVIPRSVPLTLARNVYSRRGVSMQRLTAEDVDPGDRGACALMQHFALFQLVLLQQLFAVFIPHEYFQWFYALMTRKAAELFRYHGDSSLPLTTHRGVWFEVALLQYT